MLDRTIAAGNTVCCDFKEGAFTFEKEQPAQGSEPAEPKPQE